jgi:putative salt-induced outer membrane protein YdiY
MSIANRRIAVLVPFLVSLVSLPIVASAQTPPPPPPGWIGSAAAGLALTQGNSDTSTVNIGYEIKRDNGSKILLGSTGLFIRGDSAGELTTDRLALDGRVDRKLSARTSLFGQAQYLRDSFKQIDYLISPTVGVSRLLLKNARTELGVDGGVGVVWEKNPGLGTSTDGAVIAGQRLAHKLTATTALTERIAALWKMDDFDDALYTFGIGLAASITSATQLKVELLDTLKNKPPSASVEKNDVAVLVSFVYKID